ncbi:hypothetical protein [Halopelagius longus]|uniref:Uncharacterized protein n=1 Tax=Halopelagius longus TaxID=1236180 RepID=A0A1H0Z648_9EURY|nr:hypothetical protein [Halopelagius longus]RDI72851.1 hypothetical protein DWB78_14575 [Halopelagius longus]SDQ22925.1 hypothetical protein SAMN05216278_1038 [Halopelagius longus]
MPERTADTLPTLDPGVTLLRRPEPRDAGLHRLVVAELRRTDGAAYWVDARNEAATRVLYEAAGGGSAGVLSALRIARAFTAHQHHELVRSLPGRVSPEASIVVLPRLPSLYRDPDVPDAEARRLLDSTLAVLAELADALDLSVLVTADGPDDALAARVRDVAADEVTCRRTRMGLAFESETFSTDAYWRDGWWQTTVPYWVDLLGVAPEGTFRPDADAAESATDPLAAWVGGPV